MDAVPRVRKHNFWDIKLVKVYNLRRQKIVALFKITNAFILISVKVSYLLPYVYLMV